MAQGRVAHPTASHECGEWLTFVLRMESGKEILQHGAWSTDRTSEKMQTAKSKDFAKNHEPRTPHHPSAPSPSCLETTSFVLCFYINIIHTFPTLQLHPTHLSRMILQYTHAFAPTPPPGPNSYQGAPSVQLQKN